MCATITEVFECSDPVSWDVKVLDFEGNWNRRKIKRPSTYTGEAVFRQRHWTKTPAGQAPVCVT